MIKGIFCHDLPVYKDVNGNYCSTTLTNTLFARYMSIVDELTIAVRVYPVDKTYEELHQEKIDLPGLKFLEFPNLNKFSALFHDRRRAKKVLRQAIKGADVIIIRGGTIALLAASIARKLNKPYLIECGGCAWDAMWNHSFRGKLLAPYYEYRAKKDVKHASHVIYVTKQWLQGRYPTNGESVGVSDVVITDNDENILQKRLKKIDEKQEKDPIVIATTAGLVKYKGQQYIIKAMGKLKGKLDIRYELAGGGDDSYLKSVAKKYGVEDKVVFKGQLSHNEVLDWLDAVDLYAQPSKTEGLPRALVEAMSRACPAIGSKTAGIPELLSAEVTFKADDINRICDLLLGLSKEKLREAAIKNFEMSKEFISYKLDTQREAFLKEYRDFVINEK